MNRKELVELFTKYYKPVRKNLRNHSSLSADDAEDIAQEVFLRLLRYPDSVVARNPAGYLFTIGNNLAYEWRSLKRNRVANDSEWLDELVLDSDHEPQNVFEAEQRDKEIQRALDLLPPRCCTVVLLHAKEGMTYSQIAKHLGLSDRTVLREMTRAYSKLREELCK